MYAGVKHGKFRISGIDQALQIYKNVVLTGYTTAQGAFGGQMWINRQTGDVMTLGFYDSETSARAFQSVINIAEPLMEPYLEDKGGERDYYELGASTAIQAILALDKSFAAFNE